MRSRPTAGQASLEYVAALALVAAVFLVAGPAVGAPDIPRKVAAAIKHGICIAGGDICSSGDARRAGLAPCPLKSDITGAEGTVTAFSVEVGGKWTLTVTPQSDGTVAVVRTAGGSAGVAGGPSVGGSIGPLKVGAGAEGALRVRVQAARGWSFADQAGASRFLERAVRNGFDTQRWPPAWESFEGASEAGASAGVSAGVEGKLGVSILGASAAGQYAIGYRKGRDGSSTVYTRIALDGPELSVPFAPSKGAGRMEWVAEYTSGLEGPRELAFRRAEPADAGNRLTETVARLDLRDPANLEIARALIESPEPWSALGGPGKRAVMDRIATHGTVERTVSQVDDRSWGASAEVKAGLKFAFGGRRINVHRRLVRATVRLGGVLERARLDCVPRPA